MTQRTWLGGVLLWEFLKGTARAVTSMAHGIPDGAASSDGVESGRADDRNLDPERETSVRVRRGTAWVAISFMLALAGGFAFLFFYWTDGNNEELGASLAFFLGGIGGSLVLYARRLMLRRQAIEARDPLPSPPAEREAALRSFSEGAAEIHRRGLLVGIAASALAFAAAVVVSLFRSLGNPPGPSLFDTVWKRGQPLTKSDGTPVSLDALEPGSTVIVFPNDRIGDERAQTVLLRVEERLLNLPRGRQDWAPAGYVAYSRVCTHAGCPVGMYEDTAGLLMCPCHQSTFDVLRGACPTGGPAVRSLPQLPLYADASGILRAGGGFTEPPGPGFWSMP